MHYVIIGHFSELQQDIFPENRGTLNNEQGERFRYDVSAMVKTYQGMWRSPLLAEYCWIVTRDSPGLVTKWQVKRQRN